MAVLCAVFAGAVGAFAQAPVPSAKPLEFDVISVKPMGPGSCSLDGGGIRPLADGISASCVPLAFVVESAYRLLDQDRIVDLPKWAQSESLMYSFEARVSGEDARAYAMLSREDQVRMLQQVLTDRFQMKAHMETREVAAFDLVIAKGGPKLKEPAAGEPSQSAFFGAGNGDIKWANAPLTNLKFLLGDEVGKPVMDKTGLTGKYDFRLEFTPAARAATDDSGRPSVFTALEEQLGLKLVPAKEPVEVLVIDSIEQPAAN
ncbi:MAG TPA: TIGR03435 family protein [Acidobacteriaceae bacterium]|nr:TIGR03435 family protein [Acidobacteriaceae bacterium]